MVQPPDSWRAAPHQDLPKGRGHCFAGATKWSSRPPERCHAGSMSGDTRADLFNNDLFDLLGKTFGDFHVLQNMAGF